ncbi:MAG: nucleotide disphospho-sugar-binding domain-containing protein [Solirubrobacteraceae bacterium]
MVAASGAGLTLGVNVLNHDTIRDAVVRLLTEEAFRSRALALRDEIARMPSPDDVAALLPGLVDA